MKFKKIVKRFFSINCKDKVISKQELKSKGNWKYNVTGTKNRSKHAKEFINTHFILKNRVIYPILWILEKFEKYQVNVDRQPHHLNLRILKRSIKQGSDDCFKYYSRFDGKKLDNSSYKLVDKISKWIITLGMKDHWICELINMIMYRIAINMNKEYQNNKQHLIYSENYIDDIEYFQIQEILEKKRKLVKVK